MMQASLPLSRGTFSPSSGPSLRPYQQAAIASIHERLASGQRRLLVALPTGTGKTVVFAALPTALGLRGRWLVLAHREELLEQAKAKLEAANPHLSVAIEQADRRAEGADVVVASVPTLQRARLEALDPAEFAGVIVDEAHHAVATSYRAIFDHFGLFQEGCARPLLGFTATPTRGDQVGLSSVFEAIAHEATLRQMVADGFLCPITGHRVDTQADLSGVTVRAGEFVTKELAEAIDTPERNALIVRAYRDLAPGRPAIAFCADVAHAGHLAEAFRSLGHASEAVSGETPKDERRSILARFGSGELQVVTNCNVLTEGFDEPKVSCILMARPTQSSLLYTQMLGRGTRLFPGKTDLCVLDFADNSARHNLATVATLFGLPPRMACKGRSVLEVAREVEKAQREMPWADFSQLKSIDELKLVATRIDFFSSKPPAELARTTRNTWLPTADGGFRLPLPNREAVEVVATRLDAWQVRLVKPTGREVKGEFPSLDAAVRCGDSYVPQEASLLVDSRARWRKEPATDKQLALLRRWHVQFPPGLSKGQAAAMITMRIEGRSGSPSSDRRGRPSGGSRWYRG